MSVPQAPTPMCSILLVEDHPDTRRILAKMLHRWGHHVSTAQSMAQGLALARAIDFDAIVSDIGLGDGDGCVLAQEVKNTVCARAVKVAVTAYTTEGYRAKAKVAGYHHFFAKPIDLDRLKVVLSTVL